MTKRITVTALQPLHHEGRSHVRGSVFTTTPVDAAALKYRGKVKFGGRLAEPSVPVHPSVQSRMDPVRRFPDAQPTPANAIEASQLTDENHVDPTDPTRDEPRQSRRARHRRYQRQDLQADTGTDVTE